MVHYRLASATLFGKFMHNGIISAISNISVFFSSSSSNPFPSDGHLLCLQWNPAFPDLLAVSLSDRLCLLQVKDDVTVAETKSLCANARE